MYDRYRAVAATVETAASVELFKPVMPPPPNVAQLDRQMQAANRPLGDRRIRPNQPNLCGGML